MRRVHCVSICTFVLVKQVLLYLLCDEVLELQVDELSAALLLHVCVCEYVCMYELSAALLLHVRVREYVCLYEMSAALLLRV